MRATQNTTTHPHQYIGLSFYADLSQYTMNERKSLAMITKPLRNHQITYKWGHQVKLVITKNNSTYTIRSLEEGLVLLRQWKILKTPEHNEHRTPAQNREQLDWDVGGPPNEMIT